MRAFVCDYCHEFTKKTYNPFVSSKGSKPKKGFHAGGEIKVTFIVDGVNADVCLSCAKEHLTALLKESE